MNFETKEKTGSQAGVVYRYGISKRAILNPVTRWYCKYLHLIKQVGISYKRLHGLKMPVQQIKRLLFSALPGGNRNNNGTFNNIGNNGYWWSSTENNTTNAWNRNMNYNNANVNRNNNTKSFGFSVRCLRDLNNACLKGMAALLSTLFYYSQENYNNSKINIYEYL